MVSKINKLHHFMKNADTEIALERLTENNMGRSHTHDKYEIYFLIDGERRLLLDNYFYKLEKGDLLLIAPGILHKTLDASPSEYERIVINLNHRLVETILGEKSTKAKILSNKGILIREPHIYEIIMKDIEHIKSLKDMSREQFEIFVMSFVYKLIFYFLTYENNIVTTQIDENGSTQMSDILRYINLNYTKKITISALASDFYISEYHLCRTFKKSTGRSVVEYINFLRVEKAKNLLGNTNMKIKDVAMECGFNTTTHFNHIFKEYEKLSPSSFRKFHN